MPPHRRADVCAVAHSAGRTRRATVLGLRASALLGWATKSGATCWSGCAHQLARVLHHPSAATTVISYPKIDRRPRRTLRRAVGTAMPRNQAAQRGR